MPTPMLTSRIGPIESSYYNSQQEEARRAREELLGLRTAEAQRQAQLPAQMQAARTSPENLAIANIERQRAATDYQFALAGLPTPAESEAQQGTGIGVRQALVTPEERLRRQAQVDEAQGALRMAQASERVGRAEISAERAHAAAVEQDRAARQKEQRRVTALKQVQGPEGALRDFAATKGTAGAQLERDIDYYKRRPYLGKTVDTETGDVVSHGEYRKRQAERGMTLDEVNREYVSNREMLNRVSPDGHIWRKSDNAWVDRKTGNVFKDGMWRNEEDGTHMNPQDKIWRDKNGNFYDKSLKAWVNPTTGWVQQGIYWVDPATGQRYWQGAPVKRSQGVFTEEEVAALLGGQGGSQSTLTPIQQRALSGQSQYGPAF